MLRVPTDYWAARGSQWGIAAFNFILSIRFSFFKSSKFLPYNLFLQSPESFGSDKELIQFEANEMYSLVFYVLLTVHLSIILVINQLDAQNIVL
jgi:hypothetical protein